MFMFQAICKNLIKLKSLNISGCISVSDIGLAGCGLARNSINLPETENVANGLSLEKLGLRKKSKV